MLTTQSDVFAVPPTLSVIVQIREASAGIQRTLLFQNLSDTELFAQVEYSADGGSTWTLIGTSFSIGVKGGGSDIVIKSIDSDNILRVRASGGSSDRDLYLTYTRMHEGVPAIWTNPSM